MIKLQWWHKWKNDHKVFLAAKLILQHGNKTKPCFNYSLNKLRKFEKELQLPIYQNKEMIERCDI